MNRSPRLQCGQSSRRGETSRMVPVVIVVAGVLAVWLLVGRQPPPDNTPDNPLAAGVFETAGPDESAVQAALRERGMIMVKDPERKCATAIHCFNKPLDDATLAQIATLRQLSSVHLGETNVTDEQLRHLAVLGELASLVLNDTSIGDPGLAHLAGLGKLEALHLVNTKVTDEGLKSLGKMSSLTVLDLSKTPASDRGIVFIARLPKLQWLLLAETDVTDTSLKRLETTPLLGRVTLTGARHVTPAGVAGLKAARPKLKVDF